MTEGIIRRRLAAYFRDMAANARDYNDSNTTYTGDDICDYGCKQRNPVGGGICPDCLNRIASALEPASSKSVEEAVEAIGNLIDSEHDPYGKLWARIEPEVRKILERVR